MGRFVLIDTLHIPKHYMLDVILYIMLDFLKYCEIYIHFFSEYILNAFYMSQFLD